MLLLGQVCGPDVASPMLALVIGSRSTRTCSRSTGTVVSTSSVTMYLRRRARPASRRSVSTRSSSSERVIASSVSGPETSLPMTPEVPDGVESPGPGRSDVCGVDVVVPVVTSSLVTLPVVGVPPSGNPESDDLSEYGSP